MKKVVRTVYISLLSGLAFLVACASPKGLTRAEKKQLKAERVTIMSQIEQQQQEYSIVEDPKIMMGLKDNEMQLRQRLSVINSKLGDSNAQRENGQQMGNIVTEMDSLKAVIDSAEKPEPLLYGPPTQDPGYQEFLRNQQREGLNNRLEQINNTLKRREGACVYGSPEVIQKYNEETQRLRQEAQEIQKQLEELDNE